MKESLRPYCHCSTIELRPEFVERHAFRQIRNVWKRLQSGSSRWTRVRSPLIRLTGLWARFYQLIFESDGKHLNYWSSFPFCERVLVNREGRRGSWTGGEVEKSGHQSFNGISDLSLGRMWNNWRRMSKRSVEYRFISNIVLSCFWFIAWNEWSWKPRNERTEQDNARKRKSKVKRMVEHGNIDEIRCLFFFLDAFSRLHYL